MLNMIKRKRKTKGKSQRINTVDFNSFIRRSRSHRNQSTDLQRKSIDWFLYDRDLHLQKVKFTKSLIVT